MHILILNISTSGVVTLNSTTMPTGNLGGSNPGICKL
jgi:hypothetical protein